MYIQGPKWASLKLNSILHNWLRGVLFIYFCFHIFYSQLYLVFLAVRNTWTTTTRYQYLKKGGVKWLMGLTKIKKNRWRVCIRQRVLLSDWVTLRQLGLHFLTSEHKVYAYTSAPANKGMRNRDKQPKYIAEGGQVFAIQLSTLPEVTQVCVAWSERYFVLIWLPVPRENLYSFCHIMWH